VTGVSAVAASCAVNVTDVPVLTEIPGEGVMLRVETSAFTVWGRVLEVAVW
jgi:hypothetical protein